MPHSFRRIALVDDDDGVLTTYTAILKGSGYEVYQANSTSAAYEIIEEGQFDLLICDRSLEDGKSGLDVIEAALRRNPELPVILMTGYSDTVLTEELSKKNVCVVEKPTNIPELLERLKKLLGKSCFPNPSEAAD